MESKQEAVADPLNEPQIQEYLQNQKELGENTSRGVNIFRTKVQHLIDDSELVSLDQQTDQRQQESQPRYVSPRNNISL